MFDGDLKNVDYGPYVGYCYPQLALLSDQECLFLRKQTVTNMAARLMLVFAS